jgi:hypothetical protein
MKRRLLDAPKEQVAYQLGQDVAESMTKDLDEFIEIRFGHLEGKHPHGH